MLYKVMHDRRQPFASSAKRVDLAGQRGECERAQVWGWDDSAALTDVAVTFGDLTLAAAAGAAAAVLPKGQWSYKQQARETHLEAGPEFPSWPGSWTS
jgi:hypothetical protein